MISRKMNFYISEMEDEGSLVSLLKVFLNIHTCGHLYLEFHLHLGPAEHKTLPTQWSHFHRNIRETRRQRLLPQCRAVPFQDQTPESQLSTVSGKHEVKAAHEYSVCILHCRQDVDVWTQLPLLSLALLGLTESTLNSMICWNKSWTSSRQHPPLWWWTPLTYQRTPMVNSQLKQVTNPLINVVHS